MKLTIYNILIFMLLYSVSTFTSSTPCDGLKLRLVGDYKEKLELSISKQLNVRTVDVMEEFSLSNWYVVYVDTHETDEVFLFYSSEPLNNQYTNLWGGIAKRTEENQIQNWVERNMPSIPFKLAKCFAWYVTNDRKI